MVVLDPIRRSPSVSSDLAWRSVMSEMASFMSLGIQIGATGYDPAAGFSNVPVHTHQNVDEGGQLDASEIFNGGQVLTEFGGTGIDMPATLADDSVLGFNAGTGLVEAVDIPFGALWVGRDTDRPVGLSADNDYTLFRSFYNGSYQELMKVRNNFTGSDPVSGDDDTEQYARGSLWFNTGTRVLFFCEDASTGAAVWTPQSLGIYKITVDSVDPTTSDDDTLGYGVPSLWFNTATQALWICWDASTGAADWQPSGGSGGLLYNLTSSTNPTGSDDDTMGYSGGSIWYNGVDLTLWFCFSANTGTAIWQIIWAYSSVPTLAIDSTTSTTYALTITNYFLKIDATSNNVVATLPDPTTVVGQEFVIIRIDAVLVSA